LVGFLIIVVRHARTEHSKTSHVLSGFVTVKSAGRTGADQVAGSLCIFGPGVRMTDAKVEDFSRVLIDEARDLSRAIGQRISATWQ